MEWNKCEVLYKAALFGKSKEHFRRCNNMGVKKYITNPGLSHALTREAVPDEIYLINAL